MAEMSPNDVVLSVDLGGSGLRAALVSPSGAVRADNAVSLPLPPADRGVSEVDPDVWLHALEEAVAALAQGRSEVFGRIRAICIGGFTRTLVPVDGSGRPIRAAITWRDTRARAEADELAEMTAGLDVGPIDAFHPLARVMWLTRHEPAALGSTAALLEPKDFLNQALTGAPTSDPISMARLVEFPNEAIQHMLWEVAGLDQSKVPAMNAPDQIIGPVRDGLGPPLDRLAGVPVLCGCIDTWMAVLGLGALRHGHGYIISGTSEVVGAFSDRPVAAEGLMTVRWAQQLWQVGGPMQGGADTLAWFREAIDSPTVGRLPLDRRLTGAGAARRNPDPVLFLPYISGERTPLWRSDAHGAFLGIDRNHRSHDLLWAVVEGIALANREILARATAAGVAMPEQIRIGGGVAANDVWCQVKADVLNRPVARVEASRAGLVGAAAAAWTALGHYASLDHAQDAMAKPQQVFAPDLRRTAAYDGLYDAFLALRNATLDRAARLPRLPYLEPPVL